MIRPLLTLGVLAVVIVAVVPRCEDGLGFLDDDGPPVVGYEDCLPPDPYFGGPPDCIPVYDEPDFEPEPDWDADGPVPDPSQDLPEPDDYP